jgi:hypothetical protein
MPTAQSVKQSDPFAPVCPLPVRHSSDEFQMSTSLNQGPTVTPNFRMANLLLGAHARARLAVSTELSVLVSAAVYTFPADL